MKEQLIVAETFYSIQGEGITTGCPSVFLRLGGCNLLCEGAGWRCDTIEVWKKGTAKAFSEVLSEELINELRLGANLVITGGEPLMQQEALAKWIIWLHSELRHIKPYIEVETNGTILPNPYFFHMIDQWNVSPKLSNSGETYERRFNEVALDCFNRHFNCQFKFVVANEGDVMEMVNEYLPYINPKRVVLMPAGACQETLSVTRLRIAEICKQMRFRYTDRLHITIWNKKTGV